MQKRIPKNSVTIIIKFSKNEELIQFINSKDYSETFSRIASKAYEQKGKLESFTNP